MREVVSFVCVFITLLCVRGDSYIEAYKQSQNDKLDAVLVKGDKNIDREFIESNEIPYQYGPSSGPSPNYGPPSSQYGASSYQPSSNPVYGPPNPPAPPPPPPPPAYGPPAPPPPAYGPPAPPPPVYGPPAPPPPVYGPPVYGPPSSVQVFYGMPHALNSFWEKLKFKLDLFTIGKILLKLVLFKKFVSWVAVICLLLFLPSLKSKFGAATEGGVERSLNLTGKLGAQELNHLYNSIYKALDNYAYDIDKNQNKKQKNQFR